MSDTEIKLSRLEKVDLREVWKSEPYGFTKWLAKEENLSLLSEEIGIDISPMEIETEASVGRYSVDILAKEENTGEKVIIENQLEFTDHDHLGKIITYAAGHDAKIIIWIVKDVREEHKRAIDWLNERTDERTNFFIVKIELWRIENSPIAPKFHVISRPNDWAKTIKNADRINSETKMLQYSFWSKFKEYAKEKYKTSLRLRKVYPQHWYDISYGDSKSHIALILDTKKGELRCELYIPDSKEAYNNFYQNKEAIEQEIGESLQWLELPDKKASRIVLSRQIDELEENNWEDYFKWLIEKAEKFSEVFGKYKI